MIRDDAVHNYKGRQRQRLRNIGTAGGKRKNKSRKRTKEQPGVLADNQDGNKIYSTTYNN